MKFTIVGGSMSLQEVEGYKNWIKSYFLNFWIFALYDIIDIRAEQKMQTNLAAYKEEKKNGSTQERRIIL